MWDVNMFVFNGGICFFLMFQGGGVVYKVDVNFLENGFSIGFDDFECFFGEDFK